MRAKDRGCLIPKTIWGRFHMYSVLGKNRYHNFSHWSSHSKSRATRSKTILVEIKRSIVGNMELGPVDFICAAIFIYLTISFIMKLYRSGFKDRIIAIIALMLLDSDWLRAISDCHHFEFTKSPEEELDMSYNPFGDSASVETTQ